MRISNFEATESNNQHKWTNNLALYWIAFSNESFLFQNIVVGAGNKSGVNHNI